MIRANYHTHTTFCDGKNSPEEMVEAALSLGMTALGFSGHSYTEYDPCGMDPDTCKAYRQDILRLRQIYSGRIDILLGLEQDICSAPPDYPYDYLIGSVHGILKDGHYLCVDYTEEIMVRAVESFYQGDYYAYAEDYYRLELQMVRQCRPTFIGHFDLLTKFNEGGKHFDEAHPRYQKAALTALGHMAGYGIPFEINTGAISRGYRKTPYPAPFLLKALHDLGGRIILSSDCHSKDSLLCAFEEATELARRCGFTTALVLTREGFREVPL